jgi:hypothetical protein
MFEASEPWGTKITKAARTISKTVTRLNNFTVTFFKSYPSPKFIRGRQWPSEWLICQGGGLVIFLNYVSMIEDDDFLNAPSWGTTTAGSMETMIMATYIPLIDRFGELSS